jgi:hypothetical protein
MLPKLLVSAVLASLFWTSPVISAEFATAEEAKALLERAITAVKSDEAAALAKFNSGEDGFRDRDLYVFCFAADTGVLSAHPSLLGQDVKTIKDVNGLALGQQMFDTAAEGTVSEIAYMWPRPNETEPKQKHSYYTRIGGEVCGVGYYE